MLGVSSHFLLPAAERAAALFLRRSDKTTPRLRHRLRIPLAHEDTPVLPVVRDRLFVYSPSGEGDLRPASRRGRGRLASQFCVCQLSRGEC